MAFKGSGVRTPLAPQDLITIETIIKESEKALFFCTEKVVKCQNMTKI